jgi:hypothetical protein
MAKQFSCYAVVDDYGDDWKEGHLIFQSKDLDECHEWAEGENYHSASVVKVFADGSRELV